MERVSRFRVQGNVVDLAIGVIIGGIFGKIVTASVNDLIMPSVSLVLPSGEWRQAKRCKFCTSDLPAAA